MPSEVRLTLNVVDLLTMKLTLPLAVNVILVVGHEKLNVEMQRTYGSRVTVVKIPKSGGVCSPSLGLIERS